MTYQRRDNSLIYALILAGIFLIVLAAVLNFSLNQQEQTQLVTTPVPSQQPQPNPTPSIKPENNESDDMPSTNLAPMPDMWEEWDGGIDEYIFIDYAELSPTGQASLRMIWRGWGERDGFVKQPNYYILVNPGDHIVFRCWMKCLYDGGQYHPAGPAYSGCRLGIDFYHNTLGWIGDTSALTGNPYQTDQETLDSFVNWDDTSWQMKEMNFHVLNYYDEGPYGAQTPQGIIPWIQVMPWENTGYGYFSDAYLAVNPDSPQPTYYYVTTGAGVGGQVTPLVTDLAVMVGQNFSCVADADNDYVFANWTRNGSVVSSNPNYTMTDGQTNMAYNILASFTYSPPATQYFTVIASAGANGSVAPSGTSTSPVGTPVTLTATADPGYSFSYWQVAGENYSEINPVDVYGYADQTITITGIFEVVPSPPPPPVENRFTVYASASSGGTVLPAGESTALVGGSITVRAYPKDGYKFAYWLKNGMEAGTSLAITVTSLVVAVFTVYAYFKKVPLPTPPMPVPPSPVDGDGYAYHGAVGSEKIVQMIKKFESVKPIDLNDIIEKLKRS